MDTKKVISQLMAVETNNVVKDLVVRNINVTECETYNRVAITLDKPVKAMVAQEDGSYVEGESNIIFVGNYSIVGALRENEDVAFAGNHLIKHPQALNVILSGAKINIIQEAVTAGQEYTNPFSNNAAPTVVQHDSFYNHVFNIRLSAFGLKMLDKLAEKMMFGDI